jgi:pyruvate formate lyase activating enzyme
MHEAFLYRKSQSGKVVCTACSHKCKIAPGQSGICGVRLNKGGKLFLLVYGKASAVNIDPIEKKPLYHFLPGTRIFSLGTVGCNFRCSFCQNWELSQATKEARIRLLKESRQHLLAKELKKMGRELPPQKVLSLCKEHGIRSVAYTYNEPVIFFEYLYDIAKIAHKNGIKNVFVSNGYESREAMKKIAPFLDGINIDLKSFSDDFYRTICGARLEPVLKTIRQAHKLGIWTEITTLVITGKNDSPEELRSIAEFIASVDSSMPWHVTAFHPDYKMTDIAHTASGLLGRAHEIGKNAGLDFVYVGNVADDDHSNTYCPGCRALLIKRLGYSVEIRDLEKDCCKKCGKKIAGVWK